MSRQTFRQVIADVQRKPGLSRISLGEIVDSIASAAKDLGNQPWPWNYAETNVLVPGTYSTGTINVTDGTNIVNGVLTNWDPTWYGRRILFGSTNIDYIVQTIVNPTQILLAQPVNLGANIAGGSYSIYQDTFLYPTDYIIGSDVGLWQGTIRTRVPKIPRYRYEERMNAWMRSMSSNIMVCYADQGEDLTTGLYRFRLGPPASGPAELRLCYHQMAPDLVLSAVTTFPEGYDEIISLTASSKLYDLHKMPGESEASKALAAGKIRLLKRQVATQTIDDVPEMATEVSDSSISQWGMMIGRVP